MAPNILFFMTDQQHGATVLDNSQAIMPRVQAFRKQGLTFSHTYCPSPHCCPSRATFFTGLYPTQHGIWHNVNVGNAISRSLRPDVRLWSEDLAAAGYRLAFSGKWHVSNTEAPSQRGWQEGHVTCAPRPLGQDDSFTEAFEWSLYKNLAQDPGERQAGEIRRPGYGSYHHYGTKDNPFGDETVVESAEAALDELLQQQDPWCLYCGTLGPHDPYIPPQRFLDMYKDVDISLPESFHDRMTDKPALYQRTRQRFDQLSEAEHKESIRHYLAFCSYEDWLFGRLLDKLDASGQAEDTLVVYCSDHGDYLGAHGLWCKGLPCFKDAYHVPFVCRWPKGIQQSGRSVDAFISLADVAPTVLDISGNHQDRHFAGASLHPFFNNEEPDHWRQALFTQSNGNELYGIQRSVMTKEWKYVFNGFDFDELYNLKQDPHEMHNLLHEQQDAHPDIVKNLSGQLWRFAHDNNDTCINPYIMVSLAPYGPGYAFAD